MEFANARGDVVVDGYARDFGHRLDLFRCRSCHAASAPSFLSMILPENGIHFPDHALAGARLWPESGMAM